MRQCSYCNTILRGRADKKFCTKECSNKHHSKKRKEEYAEEVKTINRILQRNREILVQLFEGERRQKLKMSRIMMSKMGFDFDYITGIYKNSQGKLYRYVYDYAWMEFSNQEILLVRKKKKN